MTAEIEEFLAECLVARGIDVEIGLRVAMSEGGVDEYALRGTFPTGSSWWAYQLHYGGAGYEYLGTVAGMGNGFTELTLWQPGEEAAWRDAARYALNRAKNSGWSAWYGAAHVGIGKWDGIDRTAFWDANAETWDFEHVIDLPPTAYRVVYDRAEPPHMQNRSYDCSQESIEWSLYALGREPSDDWMENAMIAEGVMTPDLGCTDASGNGLAAFIRRHYAEYGYDANTEQRVSWDWICNEGATPDGSGHAYPVMIGGGNWYHWAVVRDFDPASRQLMLANSAPGWGGVGQTMNREQWESRGPWNIVRVTHRDLFAPPTLPPVEPPVEPPTDTRMDRIREHAEEIITITEEPAPS